MTTDTTDTEAWVEDFLMTLCELAEFDLDIEEISIAEDETICVGLSGPDSARAIGRDGQVLDAIQQLLVTAAIHSRVAHRRIFVDIEHYRARREQRLKEEAADVAAEVTETGRAYDFEPMSPRERRVIHMVLADIKGVISESEGRGDDRYVRVLRTPDR